MFDNRYGGGTQGPGEIKRRDVVLDPHVHRVQARSRGGMWCWTLTYTGSRRDQEEGGGAGPSRTQGPGEIKRRDVVLDPHVHRVQARSRGGMWCWTLTYTGSRRDQEEGCGAGPSRIQGPGEIKRREVMLDPHVYRVQARSRGGR